MSRGVFALSPAKPEAVVRYLSWVYQPSVDLTEFSRRLYKTKSEFTPSIGSMSDESSAGMSAAT